MNAREGEDDRCIDVKSATSLYCEQREYTLDAVLSETASQGQVFDLTAHNIVTKVMEGYNGCVFAYGQTGSGKTYSMLGGDGKDNIGIIQRSCAKLFAEASSDVGRVYFIKGTFLEIYQERLRDLLAPPKNSSNKLQIRHDKALGGKGIYVTGVRERLLSSTEDVLRLLEEGTQRRVVGTTKHECTFFAVSCCAVSHRKQSRGR